MHVRVCRLVQFVGVCVIAMALHWHASAVQAQQLLNSSFTYQGRLTDGGLPAQGAYDMRFDLVTAGGAHVGQTLDRPGVQVQDGVFSVFLDFGPAFGPEAFYLEIALRRAGTGSYTALSPQQPVLPAPLALTALGPWEIDPISAELTYPYNIGLGVSNPAFPVDIAAAQAVVRLNTTDAVNGSVVELRNTRTATTPAFLGAINFNDLTGATPGQLAYTGDNQMAFRVNGQERLRINAAGSLVVPAQDRWKSIHHAELRGANVSPVDDRSGATLNGALAFVPLELPDASVIEEVRITCRELEGVVRYALVRQNLSVLPVPGSEVMTSAASSSAVDHVVTLNTNLVVDNDTYSYAIRMVRDTVANTTVQLFGVRIRYAVTTPLP
ncbi:MAG: hypothetical protein KDA20_08495 [Phycisphaerales bacterium]|nr:hypothetical protein [Phycisphaerales bacterium]